MKALEVLAYIYGMHGCIDGLIDSPHTLLINALLPYVYVRCYEGLRGVDAKIWGSTFLSGLHI